MQTFACSFGSCLCAKLLQQQQHRLTPPQAAIPQQGPHLWLFLPFPFCNFPLQAINTVIASHCGCSFGSHMSAHRFSISRHKHQHLKWVSISAVSCLSFPLLYLPSNQHFREKQILLACVVAALAPASAPTGSAAAATSSNTSTGPSNLAGAPRVSLAASSSSAYGATVATPKVNNTIIIR